MLRSNRAIGLDVVSLIPKPLRRAVVVPGWASSLLSPDSLNDLLTSPTPPPTRLAPLSVKACSVLLVFAHICPDSLSRMEDLCLGTANGMLPLCPLCFQYGKMLSPQMSVAQQ